MREILFRGKRIEDGQWVEGHYHFANWYLPPSMKIVDTTHYILQIGHGDADKIDPETVGQFTGLTDKNGKNIFEGDVLCRGDTKGHVLYSDESCRFLYRWKRFDIYRPDCFKNFGLTDYAFYRDLEVIGNIHDNPELLENP